MFHLPDVPTPHEATMSCVLDIPSWVFYSFMVIDT